MPSSTEKAKPKRVQRKRTKGWRMPPNTVYVGRPSKWGNPFELGDELGYNHEVATSENGTVVKIATPITLSTTQALVDAYRRTLSFSLRDEAAKELKGKDLACWCKLSEPCHADILLELANREQGA